MTTRTTSLLLLVGALLVGAAIGALATGALMNNRLDELAALRMEGGVQAFLERGIQPVDQAQREQIRQVIEGVEHEQMALRREMVHRHRDLFDSLRAELDVILTDEQKDQLRAMIRRERDEFRQRRARGIGPPPFGPDPDGRGGEWRRRKPAADSTNHP